jgi:PAS domain S-box-containing protein
VQTENQPVLTPDQPEAPNASKSPLVIGLVAASLGLAAGFWMLLPGSPMWALSAVALYVGITALLATSLHRRIDAQIRDLASGELTKAQGAVRELRVSEQRVLDFAESASDFFWETDSDHRFSWFSPRHLEITGVRPETLLGRRRIDVVDTELDRVNWANHQADLEARRPFRAFEWDNLDVEGTPRTFRINGKPIFDESGEFLGYRGSGVDLTSQMATEQRARQAEMRLRESLNRIPDSIALFGPDDRLALHNVGYAERFLTHESSEEHIGQTFSDLLIANRDRQVFAAEADPNRFIELRHAWHSEGSGAPLQMPLADGSHMMIRDFATDDGGRMVIVSDITALRSSQDALRTSDERLHDFADIIADWFWESDANMRFTYVSSKFEALTDFNREEYLGKTRLEMFDGEAVPDGVMRLEALCVQHETFRDIVYRRDGPSGRRHFRISGKPLFDKDGIFCGYRGVGTEVTELTGAEERLRTAEQRLVDALEASADGIAVFDAQDRLVLSNSVYRRDFFRDAFDFEPHVSYETLLRTNLDHGVVSADHLTEDWIRARVATHRAGTGEPLDVLRSDGKWIQVRDFRTEDHGTLVMISDVSELRARETALQASEQRLRDYAETAVDWFWETDAALNISYVSERFENLTGDDIKQLVGRSMTEFADIPENDGTRSDVIEDLTQHRAFRDLVIGYRSSHRGLRHLRLSGRPNVDKNGEFAGYRGSGTDVTVQIEIEVRSRALETRLKAAVEAIHDGFALFDIEDRLVLANETWINVHPQTAHLKVPGAKFEAIIRSEVSLGLPKIASQNAEEYVRARIARHRVPKDAAELQFPNGMWLRLKEYRTPAGEYVLVATDISSIKRREVELRDSERRFRAFAESSGDWFWEMDRHGCFTHVSGDEHLLNQGIDIEVGRDLRYMTNESTDSPRWEQLSRDLAQGAPIDDFQWRTKASDGVQHFMSMRGQVIRGESGAVTGYRGVARDVTTRRQVEQMLRSLASATSTRGIDEVLEIGVQSLAEVFGVRYAFIALFDEGSSEEAHTGAVWEIDHFAANTAFALAGSPSLVCASSGETQFWAAGVAAQFPEDTWLAERNIESYLSVPLQGSEGTVLGCLTLMDTEPMIIAPLVAPLPDVVAARFAAELERTRAQARLQLNEGHLRGIFEFAPVILELKDAKGRYLRVSPPFEQMYGRSPDALVGASPSDVLEAPLGDAIVKSDMDVIASGAPAQMEQTLQTPLGERTLLVQRFPIPGEDGVIAGLGSAATDITEQKIAEDRAKQDYDLLRAAIGNVKDGFALYDHENCLVLFNDGHREIYAKFEHLLEPGIDRSTVVRTMVEAGAFKFESTERRESFVDERLRAAESRVTTEIELASDRWIEVRDSFTPDGGTIIMTIDITARKQTEQALENYRDHLEDMVSARTLELERTQSSLVESERLATIGRLAATVSHELRNPLGAVRNAAYLLKRKADESDEQSLRYINIMERELHHSDRIIDDLLETTRVKDPHIMSICLGELIAEIAQSKALPDTIVVNCAQDVSSTQVNADPVQLRQVLTNLLTNTSQAVNGHGAIDVQCTIAHDVIEIKISDQGPGIADDLKDRIFEPLFTTKSKGNGLGLWISREIMRRHGGGPKPAWFGGGRCGFRHNTAAQRGGASHVDGAPAHTG